MQKINGVDDIMTLKEQIELAELTEQAEQQQVPVEVMKRLQELEVKAQKADQLEKQQQEQQTFQTFQTELEKFAKENEADAKALADFMYENQVGNFNVALKAMKAEDFEKKANEKEADTIKRYLATKSAPRVEGSTGAAATQTVDTSKMSWDQIAKHSAERVKAMNTPQ